MITFTYLSLNETTLRIFQSVPSSCGIYPMCFRTNPPEFNIFLPHDLSSSCLKQEPSIQWAIVLFIYFQASHGKNFEFSSKWDRKPRTVLSSQVTESDLCVIRVVLAVVLQIGGRKWQKQRERLEAMAVLGWKLQGQRWEEMIKFLYFEGRTYRTC